MARPTQYQKLSLQLDAENKKLKEKLTKTKGQLNSLKSGASGVGKSFGKSFDAMGGRVGQLKSQFTGLIDKVATIHPAVAGLAAVGGTLALAFKDLTAYTTTWEGSLSDAGRKLASLQTGFKSFITSASEARGKALAEGGVSGYIDALGVQIQSLFNGTAQIAANAKIQVADVVNTALLTWRKGLLETTVQTKELRAQTQELYNQFRDKALMPEDRLQAVETYKARALELYELQKENAENELEYLLEQSKLSGNSFEDNLKIEEKKAAIADLEREYLKLLGRTIEYENSITAELQKQMNLKRQVNLGPELKNKDPIEQLKKQATARDQENKAQIQTIAIEKKRGTQAKTLGKELQDIQANSIKGLISEGITAAITSALKFIPPPFNLVAAGTAATGAMALFSKLVPSFDVGTDYVPRDMLAMIHKGEKIIPADQNKGDSKLVAVVSGSDLHFVMDEYSRRRGNTL